jgi:glutaminase
MNRPVAVRETSIDAGPIGSYLADLFARHRHVDLGEVATYIPELAKADPDDFAIAIATVDGKIYRAGEADRIFTIQSVSKPFVYGYALAEYGRDAVLAQVGVEPTGEAFNSIVLDEVHNRPFNPMVNAGAIAAAELIKGDSAEARVATMLDTLSRFAGRPLTIDEAVFRSEEATGHRNRAIAYMMLNSGMIRNEPERVLEVYFRQCAVRVTAVDLAVMAATLANSGVNPLTREHAMPIEFIPDVLTVMNSCGMYNYAGQWSYEVGMPAKSGVSGGILAVIPGQIGIGVYSPRLDSHGNSVRGVRVCKEISETFGLHVFRNHTRSDTVVRTELRGSVLRSKRRRSREEQALLDAEGARIVVLEVQGALFFGSAERLLRRVDALAADADYVVVDVRRVYEIDNAAARLLLELFDWMEARGKTLIFAHLTNDAQLGGFRDRLLKRIDERPNVLFEHRDQALEWCENRIIAACVSAPEVKNLSLGALSIFSGLTREQLRTLETIVKPMAFEPGQAIVREGDVARLFFVVASGSVSVQLRIPGTGNRVVRLSSMGPGVCFGEMAILDGGKRSADVVADEKVLCYGFSVDQLKDVGRSDPEVLITIMGNMLRDFSERIRRANDEIRALEQ